MEDVIEYNEKSALNNVKADLRKALEPHIKTAILAIEQHKEMLSKARKELEQIQEYVDDESKSNQKKLDSIKSSLDSYFG